MKVLLSGGTVFVACLAIFISVCVFAGRYGSENARIERAIKRARTVSIRDVLEGQIVRLTGTVHCIGEPLAAPLSGRRCAEYHLVVTQADDSEPLIDERRHVEFLLNDGTGKARICMDNAEIDVTMDGRYSFGARDEADKRLESALRKHGYWSHGVEFDKNLSCEEGVLEEGERITVLGRAQWEADPNPGPVCSDAPYRESPRRLVLTAPSRVVKLLVSDDLSTVKST